MRRFSVWLLIFCMFPPAVFAETVILTADQWARPRSGAAIAAFTELRGLVEGFDRGDGRIVLIRHEPSDEGVLWAAELRSWFVALGVPSRRTRLQPEERLHGRLEIDLTSE